MTWKARRGVLTSVAARGVSAASWTPLSLGSKLKAYYDTKLSTITQSGGTVSQIDDLSGNGYHLTDGGNSDHQPAYNATGFGGGKPSLDFNVGAIPSGGTNVLEVAGIAHGGSNKLVLAGIGSLNDGGSYDAFCGTSDVGIFENAGNATLGGFRGGSMKSNGSISFSTRFNVISRWDGTNNTLIIDGSAQATAADSASMTSSLSLAIGNRPAHDLPGDYKIGVMILLNDDFAGSDQADLITWLAAW